jgi:hypothetical protein
MGILLKWQMMGVVVVAWLYGPADQKKAISGISKPQLLRRRGTSDRDTRQSRGRRCGFAQLTVAARDDNHIGFLPRGSVHWGSRRLPVGGSTRMLTLKERSPNMRKTLFCGVDLHSNNAMYFMTDQQDKPVVQEAIAESAAGGPGVPGAFPQAA